MLLFFLPLLLILSLSEAVMAKGVSYKKYVHGKFVYDTVWINLKDPNVRLAIQVPGGFPLSGEGFRGMVGESHPAAAITGTYFNMSTHVPVGDIVMFGQIIHYGGIGTALAITKDNSATFKRVPLGYVIHWDNYDTVLAAGPTLLKDGVRDIHPEEESFSDKAILGRAVRCAIGLRDDGTMILLCSRGTVSLGELADTFKSMGCRDAMNLDGGSSSALYCNSSYYRLPKRALTNLFLVFDSASGYDKYRKASAYKFYRTGSSFRAKGKNFQAMLNFRGAAAADPTNAAYFRDLAETYSNLGWDAWCSLALSKSANLYDVKGQRSKALYYYQKALTASSENVDAHRWMAEYYRSAGNQDSYAFEKKQLNRCIFTSFALKQSIFNPESAGTRFRLEWEDQGDGAFHEKTFGITVKMPEDWQRDALGSFYQVFQDRDCADCSFLSFEAIKSEIFTDLGQTIKMMREKRGGTVVSENELEVCGFPGKEETLRCESFDGGVPWMFNTLYVKRSRHVFVFTYGAPQDTYEAASGLVRESLKTLTLDTNFRPNL